ncbi:AN34B protein, partial [Calyptomena viridis]|nr:AN34B protein [Calyptomena viridis]
VMEAVEVPPEGYSLIKAVYQRRLRLTRLLIDGGAYVNESNNRGETPLMVACMTKHVDLQSASKAKIVKYLLDNKADPNIQDKSGKTALMHACLGKAGPEVVSLLLMSGADPSLPDHSNCSALVYAINSADKETLEVLLNACKARGKEVIIITMDKSTSGRQKTRQYLNVPPPDLGECHSTTACTSPSGIESSETPESLFSFRELYPPRKVDNLSQTVSLTKPSPTQAELKLTHVQQFQCEPWIKCCPAVFHQRKIASLKELQDITPVEKLSCKARGIVLSKRVNTTPQSIDRKDTTAHILKISNQTGSRKPSPDKKNYQTPFVEKKHNPSVIPMGKSVSLGQISLLSNLSGIIRNRNAKANHDSSDSQLTTSLSPVITAEDSKSAIGKKEILSPSHSLLSSSRGVREKMPPVTPKGRNQTFPEGQGSGGLVLDQTRPGFLPPLNMNSHSPVQEITVINTVSEMISCGQTQLVPAAPTFPRMTKNTNLLRRR